MVKSQKLVLIFSDTLLLLLLLTPLLSLLLPGAEEAAQAGLVSRLVPEDMVDAEVDKVYCYATDLYMLLRKSFIEDAFSGGHHLCSHC